MQKHTFFTFERSLKMGMALLVFLPACTHFRKKEISQDIPAHVTDYLTAMDLINVDKNPSAPSATAACDLLKNLSEGNTTLKNLASLQRELHCSSAESPFQANLKNIPSWYSSLIRQVQNKRIPEKDLKSVQAKVPKTWQEKLAHFRTRREFNSATELIQQRIALANSEDESFQLYKTLRQVHKTAQNRKAYLETGDYLLEVAKKSYTKDPTQLAAARRLNEAYSMVIRAYWTDNFIEKAKSYIDEAEATLKGNYSLQEILYLRGAILKEQKDLENASAAFQLALAEKQYSPDIQLRLLWSEAWLLMKLQKFSDARPLFKKYAELHPDNLEKFRGQFWAARMLKETDIVAAQKELEDISQKDMLGFYGLLAHRELGKPIAPAKNISTPLEDIENEKDRLLIGEARDLLRVNENSIAARLINHIQIKINRYTLFAYDPQMVFPHLFEKDINDASQKSKLRPEFIYAIIRQESSFDPEARSLADAFGLMQLLPTVAEQTAKENKIPYKEAFDLFKPSVNVPIGAFELKKLMKQFDDQFILAVARYNASEEAINGWLKVRYSPDPVEFIEDIGYDETRNYVKLVMRNHITYQRLKADKEFAFPEELLKWNVKTSAIR